MVVELPSFKSRVYKTAKRVLLWIPSKHSSSSEFTWLYAEWDEPPIRYGSCLWALARASSEDELRIWWDMQNESIPIAGELDSLYG